MGGSMNELKIFCELCDGAGSLNQFVSACKECNGKGYTELEPQWSGLTSGISVYHPNGGKSMDRLMLQGDHNLALYLKVLPKTVVTAADPLPIKVDNT